MRSTLRLAAALGLLACACSTGSSASGGAASSARTDVSPSVPAAASSEAAGLRTHIDLLLAEQVMIVAKETAAAGDHSDAYAGYTALLTTNLSDLAELVRTAFGSTAADGFARNWSDQDGWLVDYGIGAVTHNDGKAQTAISNLNGLSVPRLTGQITDMSGLSSAAITQLLSQQVADDKALIDDLPAQNYTDFYADLQTAYFASQRLGDALAARIAQKFPDRFPGDPTVPAVDKRVLLNTLLQDHAYLATMATDAVVGSRDADKSAATAALAFNEAALSRSLSELFGGTASADFDKAWSARDAALVTYAQKGDSASKQALNATESAVASAAHVSTRPMSDELNALIKVIDDQRGKASNVVAGDDRSAATSMQPVADAIVLGPTI